MLYISIILVIILLPLAYSGFSLAPWVPSRKKDLKRIHKLAQLKPGQKFYELGCGDGRVCSFIAKNNPKAKVVGLELAYSLYFWAKMKLFFNTTKNLSIQLKNIFHTNLSDADVIYVYGMPKTLQNQLKKKFLKELKKGTKIISYVFSIKDWTPIIKDKPGKREASILVYKM